MVRRDIPSCSLVRELPTTLFLPLFHLLFAISTMLLCWPDYCIYFLVRQVEKNLNLIEDESMPAVKKNPKQPAIFLDRDGTIIRQVELLHKPSDVKLLPGAARAIAAFNKLGYLTVIVTNQPVIARGIIGSEEVDQIHALLINRLGKRGAKIDAVYFCPHHPKANVKKYRMTCKCRKPEIGMILQAAKKYHIDLRKSFMIGDSTRDILAGNRAKLTTLLVKTGHGGEDVWQFEGKPDFVVKNLGEAARIIKKESF
jgi:mannose-1-phosphate guanylyltransferase / phosphomannomutase